MLASCIWHLIRLPLGHGRTVLSVVGLVLARLPMVLCWFLWIGQRIILNRNIGSEILIVTIVASDGGAVLGWLCLAKSAVGVRRVLGWLCLAKSAVDVRRVLGWLCLAKSAVGVRRVLGWLCLAKSAVGVRRVLGWLCHAQFAVGVRRVLGWLCPPDDVRIPSILWYRPSMRIYIILWKESLIAARSVWHVRIRVSVNVNSGLLSRGLDSPDW
jgi:hypothetical protein